MIGMTMNASRMEVRLTGLTAAMEDLRPLWEEVEEILLEMEQVHFGSEGAYAGPGWAPLSPAYAAWKQQRWGLQPIMVASGRLRDSLTRADHPDHVSIMEPTLFEFGTRVPYAVYHQAEDRGRAPFPRRIVLPLPTSAEGERIVDAALAFMLRKVREAGEAH